MIAVPHKLRNAILRGAAESQIVFISAGAGWGKTSVVRKLLEKQNYKYVSVQNRVVPSYFSKDHTIVIDDFQELSFQGEQQFRETLRKAPRSQHYILLSRAPLPEYLAPYEVRGLLIRLSARDFELDMESISQIAEGHKVELSASDLKRLHETTKGYPVAVAALLSAIASGERFDRTGIREMQAKVGAYLEETTLRRLGGMERRVLTDMSFFDTFDQSLAEKLMGESFEAEKLEQLRCATGLICCENHMWSLSDTAFLKPYLNRKAVEEYPAERIKSIHFTGGEWYAQRNEYKRALDHYQAAGSRENIILMLSENAKLHPGLGAYYEMRDYYNLLTEEEIKGSPDLICAMSMLCSMTFEMELSEKWYGELERYAQTLDENSEEGKRVRGLLTYLELARPHTGSGNLLQNLPSVLKQLSENDLVLPEMSVTSNLPSVLHGGKDFSHLIVNDQKAYDELREPVEKLLGRYGVGIGDIALTESMMDKGLDVSGQFLKLAPLQNKLKAHGTPEMEFVLTALIVRSYYGTGSMKRARDAIEHFRADLVKRDIHYLLPNVDAMRCRLSLMADDSYEHVWYVEQAPDENHFNAMDRYRYMTKVRCYIKNKEFQSALLLLGRMLDYTMQYERTYDYIEALILAAICRFRMGGDDWREYFMQALELGEQYGLVDIFTREGAAMLPLMERYGRDIVESDYWKKLLSKTVIQAGYYTHYLQPLDGPETPLTQMETMILRLLCQDWAYEEICALLDIKMPTVKTHVRNIFKKLEVGNRAEAQKSAQRLRLV